MLVPTESPLFFGRWMIRDTDRAAAGFLSHVIRASEVDQPERVVGQSWVRFALRWLTPAVYNQGGCVRLARRLHAAHRRGTHGRSFPAVTLPRPGRRLVGLSHGSGSSASRASVLPDPSMERTPANLRRSDRPRCVGPEHARKFAAMIDTGTPINSCAIQGRAARSAVGPEQWLLMARSTGAIARQNRLFVHP
jgi:hypothetical protein